MKILNFVPLLIWALGFLWLVEWSEHWIVKKFNYDYEEYKRRGKEYGAGFMFAWLVGCLIFLLIGISLTVNY